MAVSTIDALYNGGSEKVTATSTGIDVTGTVTADGLTVGTTSDYAENVQAAFYGASNGGISLASGTSGLSRLMFADGVAGTAGAYVGSIIYSHADDSLRFNVNGGTERMRISSSGQIGIGDSSPSARLQIGGMVAGEQALLIESARNDAVSNGLVRINITDSVSPFAGLQIDHAGTGAAIIANGNVLVGKTSGTTDSYLQIAGSGSKTSLRLENNYGSGSVCLINNQGNSTFNAFVFENLGSAKGSIVVTTSATSYNTSSDYRLKTDAQPMTGASARVQALNPVNFEWISSGDRVDGFLAHEAQEVVPESVTGTKDAMRDEEYEVTAAIEATYDDDGNELTAAVEAVMGTRSVPDMQGIDQSKLVPLLTAALQEALTEIASLKTRVTTLEG